MKLKCKVLESVRASIIRVDVMMVLEPVSPFCCPPEIISMESVAVKISNHNVLKR